MEVYTDGWTVIVVGYQALIWVTAAVILAAFGWRLIARR